MSSGKPLIAFKVFSINLTMNNFLLKLLEIFHFRYQKAILQLIFRIILGRVLYPRKQNCFIFTSRQSQAPSSKHSQSSRLRHQKPRGWLSVVILQFNLLLQRLLFPEEQCLNTSAECSRQTLNAYMYPGGPARSAHKSHQQARSESTRGSQTPRRGKTSPRSILNGRRQCGVAGDENWLSRFVSSLDKMLKMGYKYVLCSS